MPCHTLAHTLTDTRAISVGSAHERLNLRCRRLTSFRVDAAVPLHQYGACGQFYGQYCGAVTGYVLLAVLWWSTVMWGSRGTHFPGGCKSPREKKGRSWRRESQEDWECLHHCVLGILICHKYNPQTYNTLIRFVLHLSRWIESGCRQQARANDLSFNDNKNTDVPHFSFPGWDRTVLAAA